MSTSVRDRLRLIFILILGIAAIFTAMYYGFRSSQNERGLVLLCLIWLLTGVATRPVSLTEPPEKPAATLGHLALSALILWLAWLPKLDLIEYGFEFNLKESPAIFWMAAAFLFGFYRKLPFGILRAIWLRIKKMLGIEKGEDIKGNARFRFETFWTGLKKITGDLLGIISSSNS